MSHLLLLIFFFLSLIVLVLLWKYAVKQKFQYFACLYDVICARMEHNVIEPLRKRFVPKIYGHALDIAVGTGNNIPFYKDAKDLREVTLTDIAPAMLSKAKEKAKRFKESNLSNNSGALKFNFQQCPVEDMRIFRDESFDSILSIDVFCSVKDQDQCLRELYRVLKPNGTAIFVEHFKTGRFFKDIILTLVTVFFTYWIMDVSMVRETDSAIKRSEFIVKEQGRSGSSFQYFICEKRGGMTQAD